MGGATDPVERTQAGTLSRRQAVQMTQAMREFGGEELADIELIGTGPQLGVREMRRDFLKKTAAATAFVASANIFRTPVHGWTKTARVAHSQHCAAFYERRGGQALV